MEMEKPVCLRSRLSGKSGQETPLLVKADSYAYSDAAPTSLSERFLTVLNALFHNTFG